MNQEEVCQAVNRALDRVIEEDSDLLRFDVNERSITHRLGIYLEDAIDDTWDVDVEYNRIGDGDDVTKRVPEGLLPSGSQGRVYPDVVIHRRGVENENLLVIEAKKSNNADGGDQQKIRAYMQHLGYECGLFVKFYTGQGVEEIGYDFEWQYI